MNSQQLHYYYPMSYNSEEDESSLERYSGSSGPNPKSSVSFTTVICVKLVRMMCGIGEVFKSVVNAGLFHFAELSLINFPQRLEVY